MIICNMVYCIFQPKARLLHLNAMIKNMMMSTVFISKILFSSLLNCYYFVLVVIGLISHCCKPQPSVIAIISLSEIITVFKIVLFFVSNFGRSAHVSPLSSLVYCDYVFLL